MISTIKTYAIAALGVLSSILAVLFYRGKATQERDKRKAQEAARKAEQKATEALVEGVEREKEAEHGKVDPAKRDHFAD